MSKYLSRSPLPQADPSSSIYSIRLNNQMNIEESYYRKASVPIKHSLFTEAGAYTENKNGALHDFKNLSPSNNKEQPSFLKEDFHGGALDLNLHTHTYNVPPADSDSGDLPKVR